MNKDNYKKYVDEINKNNKMKERLQEISNKKTAVNYTKPIIVFTMVICLMLVSVFTLQNIYLKHKKEEPLQLADAPPHYRKGKDGLIYLKKDSKQPNNLEISDTPLYDTLPIYEYVDLEHSQDGRTIQSITDLIPQEQIDKQYVEPIEKILNLDSKNRVITDDEDDIGVKTTITYSYPNGVSFNISLYLYVTIWFENPEEYGVSDGDSANTFTLKVLEEFTGKPYETYTYTSSFDTPPKSNRKGYVTRSDVNDMMKSFERMPYLLSKNDGKDKFSISLPNNFSLIKVANKKMISTKQALENLKNDYGAGSTISHQTEYPLMDDQTIIQNALSNESYKDVLNIELYNSRHWGSYNYVYPSYLIAIKIPDDIKTNAEPGEIPCIVVMVTATELMPINE